MKFTGERMIPEDNAGSKIYMEHLNRYFFASQFVKNKHVIDVACGSGYGTQMLLDAGAKSVLGVDISEEAVEFCKTKYSEAKFKVGSVVKLPVEDKSIDVIVSFETIEHVGEKSQEKFIQEVGRVLKEDGVFVLSTPNALVYEKGNEFHIKELTPEELDMILKKNGFEYELFFQESVDANYILSRSVIDTSSTNNKMMSIFDNTPNRSSWETRYIIAVCKKNKDGKNIDGSVYLSNVKSNRQKFGNDSIDTEKDQLIEKLKHEIDRMKKSKFWRIRNSYMGLKKYLLGKNE